MSRAAPETPAWRGAWRPVGETAGPQALRRVGITRGAYRTPDARLAPLSVTADCLEVGVRLQEFLKVPW